MAITPYTTLDACKMALGRELSNTTDDAWITSLIPQAQEYLDNEIGYSFQESAPETRMFSGNNKNRLIVGEIQSFTKVVEVLAPYLPLNSIFQKDFLTREITAECLLGPFNSFPFFQLVRKEGQFSFGIGNYLVDGVWGFNKVPADITRACTRLVVFMYKMRDTNYADMMMEVGNVIQHFSKDIPLDVQRIIQNYQHRNFFYQGITY